MRKFQYITGVDLFDVDKNSLGAEGWELTHVFILNNSAHYQFKRELIEGNALPLYPDPKNECYEKPTTCKCSGIFEPDGKLIKVAGMRGFIHYAIQKYKCNRCSVRTNWIIQ